MLLALEEEKFEDSFQGEWIGYEADFRAWSGELIPVPDYLLPGSFVEWEVVVKGFEHICSSGILSDESQGRTLLVKQTRLLPSVGCGVDAVPTEVKTARIPLSGVHASAAGSYSEGPAELPRGRAGNARWSFGLAAPADGDGPRRRTRVEGDGLGAELRRVRVWVEERLSDWDAESATSPSRDKERSQVNPTNPGPAQPAALRDRSNSAGWAGWAGWVGWAGWAGSAEPGP